MNEKMKKVLLAKDTKKLDELMEKDRENFVELVKLLAAVFDESHTYQERQAALAQYTAEMGEAMIAAWVALHELCKRSDKRSGNRLNAVAEAARERKATVESLVGCALFSYAQYAFDTKKLSGFHNGDPQEKETYVEEGVEKVNMTLLYSKAACHRVGYVYKMFDYAANDLAKEKNISVEKKTAVSLEVLHDKGFELRSSENVADQVLTNSESAYARLTPDERRFIAVKALGVDYETPAHVLEAGMMECFHLYAPLAAPRAISKKTKENRTSLAEKKFQDYLSA